MSSSMLTVCIRTFYFIPYEVYAYSKPGLTMMKTFLLTFACLMISAFSFAESEHTITDLKIGDSPEKVIQVLGQPTGYMETTEMGIYYFDQGSVKMKDGKVTSMNLISKTQLEKKQAAEAKARAARKEKGEELLKSIKEDEYFALLPADERHAFWEKFKSDYPEVDIYILHTQAKIEAEKITAKEREEARISALERRVENAEDQAQQAAQAAQTAQIFSYTSRYNSRFSNYHYPSSIVIRSSRSNRYHKKYPYVKVPHKGSGIDVNLRIGTSHQNSRSNTRGFVTGPEGTMRTGTYLTSPGFGQ